MQSQQAQDRPARRLKTRMFPSLVHKRTNFRPQRRQDSDYTMEVAADKNRFSPRVGIAVGLLGLIVLTGWAFDIAALKQFLPGLVSMKVNTAFGFALSGTALWLLQPDRNGRRQRSIGVAFACLALLLGTLSLLESTMGINLGIDQLLMRDEPASSANPFPARMSTATAGCLLLAGISLLALGSRRKSAAVVIRVASLVVLAVSYVALVGYAYGVTSLYRISAISMALHTAGGFLLLSLGLLTAESGIGVLAIATSSTGGGRVFRIVLPILALMLFVLGWLAVQGRDLGYYDTHFGIAALVTVATIFCAGMAARFAHAEFAREQAEKAEQAERQRLEILYHATFEHAPNAMLMIDEAGGIALANAESERMFGYQRHELLGQNIDVLLPARYRSAHPGLRTGYFAAMAPRRMGAGRELHALRRDGSEFPVEIGLSPINTGETAHVLCAVIDITERIRAHAALMQLASIVESSDDGIFSKDPDGIVTSWNTGAEKIFGYTAEEIIGKSILTLIPSERQFEDDEIRRTIREGKRIQHFETVRVRRDGKLIDTDETISPIYNAAGVVVGASKIVRDITDRKRTQDLKKAVAALEESNIELQRFAYVASHDLQTPMRSIGSFIDLLGENYADRLDERGRDWIRRASASVKRLQELVRDLLEYSRLGTQTERIEMVPLSTVVVQASTLLEATIAESGAQFTIDNLPTVQGNPTQLGQLMTNLISNAIKYRSAAVPHIHISAARDGDAWRISVRDNGIGVAPEHQERIFEIFQRLHDQRVYPGTGIGLAICRRVVQHCGGRIWVESEPGQGSRFSFTIPDHTGSAT